MPEATPLTHNGSVTGIVWCQVQSFRQNCLLSGSADSHVAYLNLLEREPSRLRRIGVNCTVKLAECRSLDTALLQ